MNDDAPEKILWTTMTSLSKTSKMFILFIYKPNKKLKQWMLDNLIKISFNSNWSLVFFALKCLMNGRQFHNATRLASFVLTGHIRMRSYTLYIWYTFNGTVFRWTDGRTYEVVDQAFRIVTRVKIGLKRSIYDLYWISTIFVCLPLVYTETKIRKQNIFGKRIVNKLNFYANNIFFKYTENIWG